MDRYIHTYSPAPGGASMNERVSLLIGYCHLSGVGSFLGTGNQTAIKNLRSRRIDGGYKGGFCYDVRVSCLG